MSRFYIIDVETSTGLRPVKFHAPSVFAFWLGWKNSYLSTLETKGLFPKTPYFKETNYPKPNTKIRLYTNGMVREAVEMVEDFYPVLYRGRDKVRKALYKQDQDEYRLKVIELQRKWMKEDYIAKEPTTPRPLRRKK